MSNPTEAPVVEPSSNEAEPSETLRHLQQRIRQQEILAELGVLALQGAHLDQLLQETARLTGEGLGVQFCKVLQHVPEDNKLRVVAGVGWDRGIVGVATIGADLASPAGFALRTGKPVISNHLENEARFRTPALLVQHGIRRAMNVILQGDGKPFGVLEVDSQSEEEFVEHDLAFLQGAANLLGMAIERERHTRQLTAALVRQQYLMKEMNHRVKNSLTIVVSMLQMQARAATAETAVLFEETARRVMAIARAHERLYRDSTDERMDLGAYIKEVCHDIDTSASDLSLLFDAQAGMLVKVDDAISIALIVVELITNCAKYAYPDRSGGKVWVSLSRVSNKKASLSVRDEGIGLPENFDPRKSRGLGMRIVQSFASQLQTRLVFSPLATGTEVTLLLDLDEVQ
jgi:two-component sensor histidine kinase